MEPGLSQSSCHLEPVVRGDVLIAEAMLGEKGTLQLLLLGNHPGQAGLERSVWIMRALHHRYATTSIL